MYLNGLDELDQKIIQLLIENSRISYSDIGEKTGISSVAVKARIQALEKKGVIEEYTTIINPQKISGAVSVSYTHLTHPVNLFQYKLHHCYHQLCRYHLHIVLDIFQHPPILQCFSL